MVLSPKGEDKYEMKYVPEDFDRYDQGFFGRAKPEYIIVKGECLEKLKQQGYEVIGVFMRNWDSSLNNDILGNPTNNDDICPQEKDYNDAKK